MNFANVTGITIPDGNVVKIQETSSGRVLWQKTSTPTPEPINYVVIQASQPDTGTTQRLITYNVS